MKFSDRSASAMTRVLQAMTPARRLETAFYLARMARRIWGVRRPFSPWPSARRLTLTPWNAATAGHF